MHFASHPRRTPFRRLVVLVSGAGVIALAGCGGPPLATATPSATGTASGSAGATASASASAATPSEAPPSPSAPATVAAATAPVRTSAMGVKVTGDLGQKPALTVPQGAAPSALKVEVLIPGTGRTVTKNDTLVGNYLGQTWAPVDGKVNVFDNSWDRHSPGAFPIGAGRVIKGWDDALVGRKVGSRLLLAIPAAQAYGASPSTENPLAGKDLLFVVDIIDSVSPSASATGTPVTPPSGFPAVTSVSGKQPQITSVTGVSATSDTTSALLIKGTGPAIDPTKFLALQFVQTDTKTGQQTQATWGKAVEVVPAAQVLEVATALKGQPVGSRAVAVIAASPNAESLIVVVDVVGQY